MSSETEIAPEPVVVEENAAPEVQAHDELPVAPAPEEPPAEPPAVEQHLPPPPSPAVMAVAAPASDLDAVEFCKTSYAKIQYELSKVIVGQNKVVEEILIAIFTRSHALLVGVPGLAKTLLISTLADTLNMSFKRIQFTPDLMPSDITGTEVI